MIARASSDFSKRIQKYDDEKLDFLCQTQIEIIVLCCHHDAEDFVFIINFK